MRLIDADRLKYEIKFNTLAYMHNGEKERSFKESDVIEAVERCPTIEVKDGAIVEPVKVRHSHWLISYTCVNCSRVSYEGDYKYCPYCGALMDEKK